MWSWFPIGGSKRDSKAVQTAPATPVLKYTLHNGVLRHSSDKSKTPSLAIISSIDDIYEAIYAKAAHPQLTETAIASIQMLHNPQFLNRFGIVETPIQPEVLLINLFEIFEQHKIPIGYLSKLLDLVDYELHFIIDDNQTMNATIDQGNRWKDLENRLNFFVTLLSVIPTKGIRISFFNREETLHLTHCGLTPNQFRTKALDFIKTQFSIPPMGPALLYTKLLKEINNLDHRIQTISLIFMDQSPSDTYHMKNLFTHLGALNNNKHKIQFNSMREPSPIFFEMLDEELNLDHANTCLSYYESKVAVLKSQGPAIPFNEGIWLISQLIGCLTPMHFNNLESIGQLSRTFLDDMMGRMITDKEYNYYNSHLPPDYKHLTSLALDEDKHRIVKANGSAETKELISNLNKQREEARNEELLLAQYQEQFTQIKNETFLFPSLLSSLQHKKQCLEALNRSLDQINRSEYLIYSVYKLIGKIDNTIRHLKIHIEPINEEKSTLKDKKPEIPYTPLCSYSGVPIEPDHATLANNGMSYDSQYIEEIEEKSKAIGVTKITIFVKDDAVNSLINDCKKCEDIFKMHYDDIEALRDYSLTFILNPVCLYPNSDQKNPSMPYGRTFDATTIKTLDEKKPNPYDRSVINKKNNIHNVTIKEFIKRYIEHNPQYLIDIINTEWNLKIQDIDTSLTATVEWIKTFEIDDDIKESAIKRIYQLKDKESDYYFSKLSNIYGPVEFLKRHHLQIVDFSVPRENIQDKKAHIEELVKIASEIEVYLQSNTSEEFTMIVKSIMQVVKTLHHLVISPTPTKSPENKRLPNKPSLESSSITTTTVISDEPVVQEFKLGRSNARTEENDTFLQASDFETLHASDFDTSTRQSILKKPVIFHASPNLGASSPSSSSPPPKPVMFYFSPAHTASSQTTTSLASSSHSISSSSQTSIPSITESSHSFLEKMSVKAHLLLHGKPKQEGGKKDNPGKQNKK